MLNFSKRFIIGFIVFAICVNLVVSEASDKSFKYDEDELPLKSNFRKHSTDYKGTSNGVTPTAVAGTSMTDRRRTRISNYNEAAASVSHKRNYKLVLQNEYLLSRGRRQATTASWLAWNNWYDNWSDWLDWSNWNAWNTMNSWSGVNSWTSWDGWSSWDGWTSWDDWNAWSDWNSWTSWNTWDTWSSWGSSNNEAASLTAGGIIGIIIAIVVIFILIGICCCCCARKNASPTTTTAINLSTPTAVQYTSAQGTVSNVAPYPGPNSAHLGTAYPTDGASAYPASQAMPTAYWSPNAANNGFVPQPSAPSAPSGSAMGLSAPPPSYHLAVSSDCYSLPTGDVPHKTVSDAPQMSASVQQAAAASSSLEEGMELPTYNEYLQASSENLQASSKNLQASSESLQTSRENLLTPAENWQAPEHNSSSELPHEDHPDL